MKQIWTRFNLGRPCRGSRSDSGMATETVHYFHGAPGSPSELAMFDQPPAGMLVRNRFVDRPKMSFDAYLDLLSEEVAAAAAGNPIRLIGFSLGARVALEVALRLKGDIARIDLISPGGPLELGEFLPRMQGRAIFTLARSMPQLLPVFIWMQAQMADHFPRQLVDRMFVNSAGADAALSSNSDFKFALEQILREALGIGSLGYRREILAYVKPWSSILADVQAPVRIWQGEVDNWTPLDMARALASALPNAEPLRCLDGQSHYSTLRFALAEIAAGQ